MVNVKESSKIQIAKVTETFMVLLFEGKSFIQQVLRHLSLLIFSKTIDSYEFGSIVG